MACPVMYSRLTFCWVLTGKLGKLPHDATVQTGPRMPVQELLPEKRLLRHPNLAKAVGSDPLAARIAQLQPDCHIFG